jgi:hypothetical protein
MVRGVGPQQESDLVGRPGLGRIRHHKPGIWVKDGSATNVMGLYQHDSSPQPVFQSAADDNTTRGILTVLIPVSCQFPK